MRRIIPVGGILAACLLASACALFPPAPQDQQQALFEAKGDYETALVVANAYADLPTCSPASGPLCKTRTVLDSVRAAADKANAALKVASADLLAYQASKRGITLATVTSDIAALANTVTTLKGLVANLKVK